MNNDQQVVIGCKEIIHALQSRRHPLDVALHLMRVRPGCNFEHLLQYLLEKTLRKSDYARVERISTLEPKIRCLCVMLMEHEHNRWLQNVSQEVMSTSMVSTLMTRFKKLTSTDSFEIHSQYEQVFELVSSNSKYGPIKDVYKEKSSIFSSIEPFVDPKRLIQHKQEIDPDNTKLLPTSQNVEVLVDSSSDDEDRHEDINDSENEYSSPYKRRRVEEEEVDLDDLGTVEQDEEMQDVGNHVEEDDLAEIQLLKEKLEILQTSKQKELPAEVFLLHQTTQLERACDAIASTVVKMEEELFLIFCNEVIASDSISFHQSLVLIKKLLFPRIMALEHAASRVLCTGVINCAKKQPKPVVYGLMIPLLAENIGSAQFDIVNQLMKNCMSSEMLVLLLRGVLSLNRHSVGALQENLFQEREESTSQSSTESCWSEFTLIFVQNVLETKLTLDAEVVYSLLFQLDEHAPLFGQLPRFSKIIWTLVSKYTEQVKPHKDSLKQTLSKCSGGMVKSCLSRLAKL